MEGKKVVLHYFDLNGLGALARFLLTHGNIKFEEKRYTFDDWGKVRGDFDFKCVPVLEVDGVPFSQSIAVYHYIAKKVGNLLGKSDEQEQNILAVLATYPDFVNPLLARVFGGKKDDQANTDSLIAGVEKVSIGIEKLYVRNGAGKYFLGDDISLADFFIANMFGYHLFRLHKDLEAAVEKAAPKFFALVNSLAKSEPFASLDKALNKEFPF